MRLLEIVFVLLALVLLAPVLLIAACGIRLASPGPVFYRARRVGRYGRRFVMYKFRTMHVAKSDTGSPITAQQDARVFPFGAWLRSSKIDELPQLLNIVRGEMAIVGPRAEDPGIVERYYTPAQRETLRVRPGLTSPGSLYYYTHGEQLLQGENTEQLYVERLLPIKLAIDTIYLREANWRYDLRIVLRTTYTIAAIALGRSDFPDPPELARARQLLKEHADVAISAQRDA